MKMTTDMKIGDNILRGIYVHIEFYANRASLTISKTFKRGWNDFLEYTRIIHSVREHGLTLFNGPMGVAFKKVKMQEEHWFTFHPIGVEFTVDSHEKVVMRAYLEGIVSDNPDIE